MLPTGTRGRAWQGEISYIPKDVLDHKSPLQKFDEIHAKYLTAPRDTIELKHKNAAANSYTHFIGGMFLLSRYMKETTHLSRVYISVGIEKKQRTDSTSTNMKELSRIEKGMSSTRIRCH